MRLDEDGNAYKVDFVSIHASVKDATLWDYCIPFEGNVSIHASVKDATWFCRWLSMLGRGFNPRICKRCDKGLGFWPYIYSCFNPRICKRCDQKPTICYKTYFGFNPRICKRCDQYSSPYLLHVPVSIHASVKDATYTKSMVLLSDWRFNPRICKRCDVF